MTECVEKKNSEKQGKRTETGGEGRMVFEEEGAAEWRGNRKGTMEESKVTQRTVTKWHTWTRWRGIWSLLSLSAAGEGCHYPERLHPATHTDTRQCLLSLRGGSLGCVDIE